MSSLSLFAGSVPANYDKYLGPVFFEPYALELIERLKKERLQNVLELACGTGRVTRHLASLIPSKGKLMATDLNPDMLKLAQEFVTANSIKWQVANAQELPFDNESFDHVLCQFGVMFFPDKPKAFAETYRVLQPGGKFIFNVWDEMKYNPRIISMKNAMDDLFKEDAPDFFQKGPHSFFDQEEIRKMLLNAGFQNIKLEVVRKTSNFSDVDEIITGFVDGSPLSSYLDDKPAEMRGLLKQKLHEELASQFEQYGNEVPLQAIVIEAVK